MFSIVDPALGATEVDLMQVVRTKKGDDIVLNLDAFNKMSAYNFQGSNSVYALVSQLSV